MENGKNILIVFLILIILGLGGFIVYDKVIQEEKIEEKFKEDIKTEETIDADLAYKNYIENLKKNRNNTTYNDSEVYPTYDGEGYKFTIENNGDLILNLWEYDNIFAEFDLEKIEKYTDYKIASNVLDAFIITTTQSGMNTLYFIKEDGNLYELMIDELILENKSDIKKSEHKNIVKVVEGLFTDGNSGTPGPIFIDIEGNRNY